MNIDPVIMDTDFLPDRNHYNLRLSILLDGDDLAEDPDCGPRGASGLAVRAYFEELPRGPV